MRPIAFHDATRPRIRGRTKISILGERVVLNFSLRTRFCGRHVHRYTDIKKKKKKQLDNRPRTSINLKFGGQGNLYRSTYESFVYAVNCATNMFKRLQLN